MGFSISPATLNTALQSFAAGSAPAGQTSGNAIDAMDQAYAAAQSQSEQSNVGALSSFAGLQIPPPTPSSSQQPDYSYRQMAGLDNNGNSKENGSLAGIVDGDSGGGGDPLADSIS